MTYLEKLKEVYPYYYELMATFTCLNKMFDCDVHCSNFNSCKEC